MNDTVPINNPHRMRDQKITHAFDLEGIAPGGSPAIGHSRARTEMATCNKTNNICRYPLLVLQPQPEILAPGVTCGRPLHRPAAVEVTDNGRYLATDAEHTRSGRWPRHFLVRSRRTGLGRLGWHLRR